MKVIAHIHWSLATGGTETLLVDIVNEQVKDSSVQINIIVMNDEIYLPLLSKIDKRCHVYLVNRKVGSKNPFPILKLHFFLYKIRPDIIHIHGIDLVNYIWYPWAKKVRTIHSLLCGPAEYKYFRALYCISDAVREFTCKQGYPNARTIPNGIVCSCISHNKKVDHDGFKIVQVSRLVHQHKGQHILIDALDILVHQKGITNVTVDFIGEGPSYEYLNRLVSQKGLTSYVNFLGNRPRKYVYERICHYNLFVQPSISEGFGLTIAEAMAAQIPILVSDIPAPMEIIGNGRYGLFFRSQDSMDLSDRIAAIVEGGYEEEMIRAAYQHVKSMYDISITAETYLNEYKKI